MKQLKILCAGVIALGICYLNAQNQSSNYTIAKYSLASIIALSESDVSEVDVSDDQSPAAKAMKKGKDPQVDDIEASNQDATHSDVDETDMDTDTDADTDNEED